MGARGSRLRLAGVRAHGNRIQIDFTYSAKRYRETLPLTPSIANLKYASRLRDEILTKISLGSFLFRDYFPDSKYAEPVTSISNDPTFSHVADAWLASKYAVAPGTLNKYIQGVNFWKLKLGEYKIKQIKLSQIKSLIAAQNWNGKHHNNMLIPCRGIFEYAVEDGLIENSPLRTYKNQKVQSPPPNPLSIEEMNRVLTCLIDNFPEQILNYFKFAFFTGVRPEEQIALKWPQIDLDRNLVTIKEVRTAGIDQARTKTYQIRHIELNSHALQAVLNQKKHTFKIDEYVFHNPKTNMRWKSEKFQRTMYWKPALAELNIPYRVPYNTRHTFATMNLMAGANPMWVARQMGHATMQMLLSKYSKWIDFADRGKEKSKLEILISVTNTSQNNENIS